jgi:(R,R)-butanediol dehydrogenase/meso-butanediol dehydrogenase/diacetyl reductase
MGADVVVADLSPERVDIAARLGAATIIQPTGPSDDLADQVAAAGAPPQIVFEVTGSASGLAGAMALAPRGARVVAVGLHERPREIDLRMLTLREVELVGTNAHVFAADLPAAVDLLGQRPEPWTDVAPVALGLDRLVTDGLVPLAEGRAEHIKTIIDPWIDGNRPTRPTEP